MVIQSIVVTLGLALLANDQILDEFKYADSEAAARAWVASGDTKPVEVVEDDSRALVVFNAPFATKPEMERTIIDRKVNLDLSAAGEFTIEVAAEHPEAVRAVNLYFRSGAGWYSAGTGLVKSGWQTLRYSKAAFNIEDKPAGWHKIDGIRISCWRGQAVNSKIRLKRLAAGWNDVALIIPAAYAHQGDQEIKTALDTADRLGSMLLELGLGCDAIEDAAIADGALGKRRIAILSYNPRLPATAAEALARFVDSGGKLFAAYSLNPAIARAIGFGNPQYRGRKRPGQFAEIRFDAHDIPGLPKSVRQASWNITTADPLIDSARVIGRWYDDQGKETGHAAMLISDRGAFFSHIVLADDRAGKKQMLAAVLGRLCPSLWRRMAEGELERITSVGHCQSFEAVKEHVLQNNTDKAAKSLQDATTALAKAKELFENEDYALSVETSRKAHDALADAYLRAQPSPASEGRAWWNHSGTGAYPGDWERSAKELADAGFNMIVPNMLWAGRAHYASDVLPRSKTYQEFGDQIEQCVAACKKHGIEVHVWKVNFNLSGAPKEFVEMLRRENRLQVFVGDERRDWLCPSHPENQKLELDSMLEVAQKYDVDGLHFDYIRYPGTQGCYCDGCRGRFEKATGQKAPNWPQDVYSGGLRDAYRDWRCTNITRLVEAVHREAKKIKPKIDISAAVFGSYPDCKSSVGQDWVKWVHAGYLDFICPMDYTGSDLTFTNLVSTQLKLIDGRIPLYAGIGATASRVTLTADRVVGQIHHARRLNAAGFTIFNYHPNTAAEIAPGVGLGATSKKALPPHRGR